MSAYAHAAPKCRTCGRPIVGCAETRHGLGWVHQRTNQEACPPPHSALAEPPTPHDLASKAHDDLRRWRERRRTA